MFDLFKKKPPAVPPVEAPVPDVAVAAPEPASDVAAEPAPVDAPRDAPPEKLSWAARLKAGLGLSRDKLAGALVGVFARRKLDDAALEELETRAPDR